MLPLLILFSVQCIIAIGVIFVLKRLLDQELMNAALENFEACITSADVKEIAVRSACTVSDEFKSHLESIRRRKFVQANLEFQEDRALKGGLIIAMGDILLDFSLSGRLQHLWS